MATVIKMQREDGHTADVHPDMVEEYKKGGYVESEPKKPAAKKSSKKDG